MDAFDEDAEPFDLKDVDDDADDDDVAGDAQSLFDAAVALGLHTPIQNHAENAAWNIQNGNTAMALGHMESFVTKVEVGIADGEITEADGNALLDMASGIIANLGG